MGPFNSSRWCFCAVLAATLAVACGTGLRQLQQLEQQQQQQQVLLQQDQPQEQQLEPGILLQQEQQQAATILQHEQQPQQQQQQPQSALDAPYGCPGKPNTADLPALKIEQVLKTKKPRQPTDVTLVTQLSFERLYMLEGQCDVWSGVISAAVYIALVKGRAVVVELNSNQDPMLVSMELVEQRFKEFHGMAESKGQCKLDLQLVSQEVESVWLSALYPVNAMRNRALAGVETEVVLLLDVDFWPSVELSELMLKPAKYQSLLAAVNSGNAIVLPAFETADSGDIGVEVAREVVLEGKELAGPMFWDGRIKAFHTDRYSAGHRATNYQKWVTAARPYRISYEEGYEPYVIVARKYVPWYDERFVGYRKNKVVHLLHLAQMGMQFIVHPRAFTVHSPHPRARTWKVTHKTGLWDQLATLYHEVKVGLEQNTYVPEAMYSCGRHVLGPQLGSTAASGR
ncbi:hypothetical protein N2152v2_005801 [Parachlorella kessleri]